MTGSDQIKKLEERNEQLQKQLEGSKKKVSDLQEKLKRTRSPPPIPKDGVGTGQDTGELQARIEELTGKLAKQAEELRLVREERDEFVRQLNALREKLVTTVGSPAGGDGKDEPEYDPETQKYKLSWVGDSLKDVGKKEPPAAKQKESAGLDLRTTDEKLAAMAAERQTLEKAKPGKPMEKAAEPESEKQEKKKPEDEELEETASYSVEELEERARRPAEDSDVALVTSESGGRPVLRMHAVPDDEPAEPTFKESEESLAAGNQGEGIAGEAADQEADEAEIMTEEKVMVGVPPPPGSSRPWFAGIKKALFDHRALILKSLLFLAGAGLGVGLALLIFLGSDAQETPGEEAVEEPAGAPEEGKPGKAGAAGRGEKETRAETAVPGKERAPAELVEPIYKDAAIMDDQEAKKIGAALKVLVDKYPQDPLLRYNYARSLYHQGAVKAAIAQLEETMKLDPEMPEVHYMLGGIYLRMGEEQKAHEALNNFTRLTGKSGK